MDRCEALYEETRQSVATIRLLLLEISRSDAARVSPALADRASLIRDRFQQLSDDIGELWSEYQSRSR
jgi:hypothetical protein